MSGAVSLPTQQLANPVFSLIVETSGESGA